MQAQYQSECKFVTSRNVYVQEPESPYYLGNLICWISTERMGTKERRLKEVRDQKWGTYKNLC